MQDLHELSKEELISIILKLYERIELLEEELNRYRTKKNSRNSSIPPGKQEETTRKNKSLRERSGKKPGGQKGHKGSTLKMTDTPDQVIEHKPVFCNKCGMDLSDVVAELMGKRQVVDLPPISPIYTEHRCYSKKCKCGAIVEGRFPENVTGNIQYGSSVESLTAYLSVRQYLPYRRITEYMNDLLGLPVSEGSIDNMLSRFRDKSMAIYNAIREQINQSKVVGADETGAKVNGKKWWMWVWQDKSNTYIIPSLGRGYSTVEQTFSDGLPSSVLVHDGWSAQLKTPAKTHQLCIAHLTRDVNYLIDLTGSKWAVRMKKLFLEAIELKNQLQPEDYLQPIEKRKKLENRLNRLLNHSPPDEQREVKTFYKRLVKNREYLLQFLYCHEVPPDNNGSERAIRNIKVKQKISGQFRSQQGAEIFAVIRSVMDTCLKRGINILDTLNLIAKLPAE